MASRRTFARWATASASYWTTMLCASSASPAGQVSRPETTSVSSGRRSVLLGTECPGQTEDPPPSPHQVRNLAGVSARTSVGFQPGQTPGADGRSCEDAHDSERSRRRLGHVGRAADRRLSGSTGAQPSRSPLADDAQSRAGWVTSSGPVWETVEDLRCRRRPHELKLRRSDANGGQERYETVRCANLHELRVKREGDPSKLRRGRRSRGLRYRRGALVRTGKHSRTRTGPTGSERRTSAGAPRRNAERAS